MNRKINPIINLGNFTRNGNIPYNKGLTKENCESLKRAGQKLKGRDSYWLRKRNLENNPMKNLEIRKKSSKTKKFKFENEKYKKEYLKKNSGVITKEKRINMILPIKDTSIELKIQKFLTQLHIEYLTHQYMHIEHGYQCDIFIPSIKTIIECDGDYWHGNLNLFPNKKFTDRILKQRERDLLRTKELIDKGYRVLRLWEHDIRKMELNNFKEKLDETK